MKTMPQHQDAQRCLWKVNWWPSALVCGWLLAVTLALPVATHGQSGRRPPNTPKNPTGKADLRIETREVRLPLRAYNAAGQPVTNLTPKDVLVIEEDAPRSVTSIKLEPANIVLVLDLSNEIGTFKNGEGHPDDFWRRPSKEVLPRPAGREFADNLVGQLAPTDHLAIIQYSDKVQLIQDWTQDRDEALTSLKSKFRTGIKAKYYDALMLAAEKLQACETGRRVLVLVSDGIDSASKARQQQALQAVARTGASVFVVSWTELLRSEIKKSVEWSRGSNGNSTTAAKRASELLTFAARLTGPETELRTLAESSGGEIWVPSSFKKFTSSPPEIIQEIGAQYTLTYVTEKNTGLDSLHTVQVWPAKAGLTVRARQRYYAEGDN